MLEIFAQRHPAAPGSASARIRAAHALAAEAHAGALRRSGDPYVSHPVAVAAICADLGADADAVAAALLHDVVEDTPVPLSTVEDMFGPDVAHLVDGLTKLDGMHFDSAQAAQAATMRKMLVSIAEDPRVLLVKLCDRLHNMRTIGALPAVKAARIARETLDVYAPLAHRLGSHRLRCELEDRAFEVLWPARFAELESLVSARSPRLDEALGETLEAIAGCLRDAGVPAVVSGRAKHLWSIYDKMLRARKSFDDIFDVVAARVVVADVGACYAALGAVHGRFAPVPGRVKDYVAQPKWNSYRSIHSTLVGPHGVPVEVQIRTVEMHLAAELGVAAHFSYKSGTLDRSATCEQSSSPWVRRLLDASVAYPSPEDYLEALKADLASEEVFVFTPDGAVVELAAGATPVDFAYAIHTEVGHGCVGARVNGRLVPLDTRLVSGDRVEVLTGPGMSRGRPGGPRSEKGPSADWLGFVVTPRARHRIRQWFAQSRRSGAAALGRAQLCEVFAARSLEVPEDLESQLVPLLASFGLSGVQALFVAVGEGHLSAQAVVARVAGPPAVAASRRRRPGPVVRVDGLGVVSVSFAPCCAPSPPERLVGFVTRSRGVSVHGADCANAAGLVVRDPERLVAVEWVSPGGARVVVAVEALDRPRLLADVSAAISDAGVDIVSCSSRSGEDMVARLRFEVELGAAGPPGSSTVDAVVAAVRDVAQVFEVVREPCPDA